jgi:TolB-like protein
MALVGGFLLAAALDARAAEPVSPAVHPAGCKVAVMDLEAQGLAADKVYLAKALTDALASTVADATGCDVITRADIASMVGFEAERQTCGGDGADSCLAELGNALGVERIVAGSVIRIGAATTVSARVMNMQLGKVDARAEETSVDEATLRDMTRRIGQRLFGVAPGSSSSSSSLSSSLLIGGGIAAGLGVAAAGVGALLVLPAEGVLGTSSSLRTDKDAARSSGSTGLVVGAVGLTAVVIGGGLAVAALVME